MTDEFKGLAGWLPAYIDTWEEDHKNDYKFSVPFLGGQYRIKVDMFEKKSTITWNSCDMHNYKDECDYGYTHYETLEINDVIDKDITLEEIRLYLTFS